MTRTDRRAARAACLLLLVATVSCVAAGAARAETTRSDEYARGYANALLRDVFSVSGYALEVEGGVLRLDLTRSHEGEIDTLARSLSSIEGVRRVEIRDAGGRLIAERSEETRTVREPPDEEWDLFPAQEIFGPLLADPRWPHFSAGYEAYLSDTELDHVAAVSFGETFALLRSPAMQHGQWEIGLQAGVFSVFDLASDSFDLVNSDFSVGGTLTHRLGDVTSMLRVYHQSSHLGDEFLLRDPVDRVNLSYEAVDLLVSYAPRPWLRLYGGGGLLVHREPDLDRWLTQGGIELQSAEAFWGNLRPVAALDLQFRQESDWKTDLSTRFGFQIEHERLRRMRVRILGRYYRGRSPNGQFYERRIETLGAGLHLAF